MASAKGGAGKTILTATFASFLVAIEKRVLIVDADAATNGLTLMYLREVLAERDRQRDSLQDRAPAGLLEAMWPQLPTVVSLESGVDLVPAVFGWRGRLTLQKAIFLSVKASSVPFVSFPWTTNTCSSTPKRGPNPGLGPQ
jgi:Mrp family chromosome partitioning ATPase